MMETILGIPLTVVAGALVAYLLAGLVKGTLGIGLPTAGVSLTAQITDARTAIALVIMPMLITNVWQVYRSRQHTHRALRFLPMAATMMVCIALFALIAPSIPARWVTLFLGIIVAVFALTNLWREVPALPPRLETTAQITAGSLAGLIGGITGVWAPPIVIFLSAVRVDKNTFVAVVGVLLMLGSAVLAVSYASNGLLSSNQAVVSLLLVIPSLIGFSLGERIRHRLNEERFKRLILLFFLVMGLNLVRKALL